MFRASSCPSPGAYQLQQQQPLVYRRNVVVAVLLAVFAVFVVGQAGLAVFAVFVVGKAGRPARPRTQHDCHHDTKVKLEAATVVIELLMMGGKTPETC